MGAVSLVILLPVLRITHFLLRQPSNHVALTGIQVLLNAHSEIKTRDVYKVVSFEP